MLKKLLAAALAVVMMTFCASAATILPQGSTQFFDNNGQIISGGLVYFYIPGTTTPKATYGNAAATSINTNPVQLDSSGRAVIYGNGSYQETLTDANGNLIWSQITADTASTSYSWAGTSGGSANAQTLTAANFSSTDGQVIGFVAGFTNTGAVTVHVNGGSPVNVAKASVSGPVALSGGEIVAGNQYQISYSATNGSFQLVSYPLAALPITDITGLGTGVQTALQAAVNSPTGFLIYQAPHVTVLASGSGTYATPAGTQYLELEMVGGGAGGGGAGSGATGGASTPGGQTTFGTLTCGGGGAAPVANSQTPPAAAIATGGDLNITGGVGGPGNTVGTNTGQGLGGIGAPSPYGAGGYAGSGSSVIPNPATGYGAGGGGGYVSGSNGFDGWGGSSGAALKKLIVSPATSYTYAIGAGGAGGAAGTGGSAGSAGSGGMIRIVAHFQ